MQNCGIRLRRMAKIKLVRNIAPYRKGNHPQAPQGVPKGLPLEAATRRDSINNQVRLEVVCFSL